MPQYHASHETPLPCSCSGRRSLDICHHTTSPLPLLCPAYRGGGMQEQTLATAAASLVPADILIGFSDARCAAHEDGGPGA